MEILFVGVSLFIVSVAMVRLGFLNFCALRFIGQPDLDPLEINRIARPHFFPASWWIVTILSTSLGMVGAFVSKNSGFSYGIEFAGVYLMLSGFSLLFGYIPFHFKRLIRDAVDQIGKDHVA